MRYITGLLALTAALMFVPTALHADIYSWTDENGVKHFGNRPPDEATDAVVEFKEYQYNPATDQKRMEVEQTEWQELFKIVEEEDKRQKVQNLKKAEEARQNRQPTQLERVAAEQERLQAKIAELEEKPLEYYGSYKNKRVRLGYYRYRLETLMQNPEKYFNKPVAFEGNVKPTDDDNRSY